jgi:hypothetical protein
MSAAAAAAGGSKMAAQMRNQHGGVAEPARQNGNAKNQR